MESRLIRKFAQPDSDGLQLLRDAMQRLNLSARAYDRILKVARTIADLDGKQQVETVHLAEAISYRNLDRSDWAERWMLTINDYDRCNLSYSINSIEE